MNDTSIEYNSKRRVYLDVLEKLKPIVCNYDLSQTSHGDLKELCNSYLKSCFICNYCVCFLLSFDVQNNLILITRNDQPENILIDYNVNNNDVTNFNMVIADWGSAEAGDDGGKFYGGTPVYAGPNTFSSGTKDSFSFGRLAMEFFMDKSGTESKL